MPRALAQPPAARFGQGALDEGGGRKGPRASQPTRPQEMGLHRQTPQS